MTIGDNRNNKMKDKINHSAQLLDEILRLTQVDTYLSMALTSYAHCDTIINDEYYSKLGDLLEECQLKIRRLMDECE